MPRWRRACSGRPPSLPSGAPAGSRRSLLAVCSVGGFAGCPAGSLATLQPESCWQQGCSRGMILPHTSWCWSSRTGSGAPSSACSATRDCSTWACLARPPSLTRRFAGPITGTWCPIPTTSRWRGVGAGGDRLVSGSWHVLGAAPLLACALAGALWAGCVRVKRGPSRIAGLTLLAAPAVYAGYELWVGGDAFAGTRLFAPVWRAASPGGGRGW
jgi:hypothetical protein